MQCYGATLMLVGNAPGCLSGLGVGLFLLIGMHVSSSVGMDRKGGGQVAFDLVKSSNDRTGA